MFDKYTSNISKFDLALFSFSRKMEKEAVAAFLPMALPPCFLAWAHENFQGSLGSCKARSLQVRGR